MINVNSTQKVFEDSTAIADKKEKAIKRYSSNVLFELYNVAKSSETTECKFNYLS